MRAAKRDIVESQIIQTLYAMGCSVRRLSQGGGLPDLLCAINGITFLVEVKSSKKSLLRPSQMDFVQGWKGAVYLVHTPTEAAQVVETELSKSGRGLSPRTSAV